MMSLTEVKEKKGKLLVKNRATNLSISLKVNQVDDDCIHVAMLCIMLFYYSTSLTHFPRLRQSCAFKIDRASSALQLLLQQ